MIENPILTSLKKQNNFNQINVGQSKNCRTSRFKIYLSQTCVFKSIYITNHIFSIMELLSGHLQNDYSKIVNKKFIFTVHDIVKMF